jgi:streptogramin lyase
MACVESTALPVGDSRRRRFRIAVVVVSGAVAIAGSVVLATRASSERTTTRGVTASLHVPGHPEAVAAGRDALWVALGGGDGRLVRLDLATGAQLQSVYLDGEISHITRIGSGRLVASVQHRSGRSELAVIDWRNGTVIVRRWFDPPVDQTVVRGGDLWAMESRAGALQRVNARTLEPNSPPLPLSSARALALTSGEGYLWATTAGEVIRIDPATRSIARVHVGGIPIGVAIAAGSVWLADRDAGQVVRLDARSLRPVGKPARAGTKPSTLMAAAGALFVVDEEDGTVVRLDARSGMPVGLPIRIASPAKGATISAVASSGQSVWVSSFAASTVSRIDSTAGRRGGAIRVLITGANRGNKGDSVTNGGLAGVGHFRSSGVVSDEGKVAVYRTVKLPLITLRYVTAGRKGTIAFLVKIDTKAGTARWTISSATRAYEGLHGDGTEKENGDFTVQTLTGTVSG